MLLLLFPHGYNIGGGTVWVKRPALTSGTWTRR